MVIKKLTFLLLFLGSLLSAQEKLSLSSFPIDKVMVVAHRGDWRNAPENSAWAIKNAIKMGVNMAEIDLAMTKDSVLILMHDQTIDRTTTGKGKPQDYTLAEIKEFYLRDGLGVKTNMKVPTLDEILEISKGHIFLNLDKGFNYISTVYPKLERLGMLDEVLFKGTEPYQEFNKKYSRIKAKIHYMPIVRLQLDEGNSKINDYERAYKTFGFEFTVGSDESRLINFKALRKKGKYIWINALWPEHNAGHENDKALINPNIYDWYLEQGVNIIQTDRPLF